MKRSVKLKRVSWASGVNLCQTALFRKEDPPSKVGLPQEHLQIKISGNLNAATLQSNDLPPGFGGPSSHVHRIPSIKWSSPPKFAVNPDWNVAAGEGSQEVGAQFLRESKVLESVYPRPSSIPYSPSVSLEAQAPYDDNLTPVIPIIPIEEMGTVDPQPNFKLPPQNPEAHKISEPEPHTLIQPTKKTSHLRPVLIPSADPDVAAAASAALTALLKSTEQGSMIDTNLLIKILNDPIMVEKLRKNSLGSFSSPKSDPLVSLPGSGISAPNMDVSKAPLGRNQAIPYYGSDMMKTRGPAPVPVPNPILGSDQVPCLGSAAPAPKLDVPQAPSGPKQDIPSYGLAPVRTPGAPASILVPVPNHGSVQVPCSRSAVPFPGTRPVNASVTASISVPVISAEAVKPQPLKGIDYYKNLVRQHGVETQQNMDQICRKQNLPDNLSSEHQKLKPREKNIKCHQKKQCMFFNSPTGCRNGSNCPFQHGPILPQWKTGIFVDEPSAKRMRLSGEIMGR